MGPNKTVLIIEVSLFQRFIYTHKFYIKTGPQLTVLIIEVSLFLSVHISRFDCNSLFSSIMEPSHYGPCATTLAVTPPRKKFLSRSYQGYSRSYKICWILVRSYKNLKQFLDYNKILLASYQILPNQARSCQDLVKILTRSYSRSWIRIFSWEVKIVYTYGFYLYGF